MNLAVNHDLKNRSQAEPWKASLRILLCMCDADMRSIEDAGRKHINAVPSPIRFRDRDGAPSLAHGRQYTARRTQSEIESG